MGHRSAALQPHRLAALVASLLISFTLLAAASTQDRKSAAATQAPVDSNTSAAAKPGITDTEKLSFDQSKVSAQMSELEGRMFRLAESLKQIEPANSARLKLAVKAAREELILHQMRAIETMLTKAELGQAVIEEKTALVKLQRLLDLLLSPDLDFEMMMERLKLLRRTMQQLDAAIAEEDRELKQSRETLKHAAAAARLSKRRKTLDDLIRAQTAHVEDGRHLADGNAGDPEHQRQSAALAAKQEKTRTDTEALATVDEANGGDAKSLAEAQKKMADAVANLNNQKPKDAFTDQEAALATLKQDKGRTLEELKRREKNVEPDRFDAMRRDQIGNRQTTEAVTAELSQFGEDAASAGEELVRASGAMSTAEEQLGRRSPAEASHDQERALESLRFARQQLLQSEQQLLERIHAEVRKKSIEAIAEMLERQITVRESTQSLAARRQTGGAAVLSAIRALAPVEARIIAINDDIVQIIEKTEFGVALGAALKAVGRGMSGVQKSLDASDASDSAIAAERGIERDLAALLDAMKQLPSPSEGGVPPRGQRDQERELNRLIAEVKILRVLQIRVNQETIDVNQQRPDGDLPPAIREAVKQVEQAQAEVERATRKLSERLEQ